MLSFTYFAIYYICNFFSTSIDFLTIQSNFPVASCQRVNVPHVNHRPNEALKECSLVADKGIDNGNCCSTGCGKQLLVRLKKTLLVLEVPKVVVIKSIWTSWIQVAQIGSTPILWTCLSKTNQVG